MVAGIQHPSSQPTSSLLFLQNGEELRGQSDYRRWRKAEYGSQAFTPPCKSPQEDFIHH